MNKEFEKSPKLKKWLRWMETIHDEISGLLRDANMFWEVQDIIRANPRIQKPSAFNRYLARTYLSHALAGLRRQIKSNNDSISFIGLLEDIADNPEQLSRSFYRSLCAYPDGPDTCQLESESKVRLVEAVITDPSQLQELVNKRDFDKYADASGTHVCPQMVKDDRNNLKSAVEACEEYADKRIAHLDKDEPGIIPTYGELDDCIKLLDKTYVKYHLLFYAEGMSTLTPTYQSDWKKVFLEPWLAAVAGSARGRIHLSEDFDEELPEFREYMQ